MISRPYTERGLKQLVGRANEARRLIVAAVVAAAQADGHVYWGQFLDQPRQAGQRGIYGTCASIEILLSNGYSNSSELVANSVTDLPLLGGGASYTDATDIGLVFKVAAIVTAARWLESNLTMSNPAVTRLIEMTVDDRGWGNYAFPEQGVRDPAPRVVPTAMSLLALEGVRQWRAEVRCDTSLAWLAHEMATGGGTDADDALGLLALAGYGEPLGASEWKEGVSAAQRRVIERLAQRHSTARVSRYHYSVALPDGTFVNHYMFFLPDVIGALALLKHSEAVELKGPSQVLHVVGKVANSVRVDRGYRGSDHQQLATVDQLWVSRLMTAFVEAAGSPASLLPGVTAPLATRKGRCVTLVATLMVGVGCSILSIGDLLPGFGRGLSGAIAAIALGLLVTAFRWFG